MRVKSSFANLAEKSRRFRQHPMAVVSVVFLSIIILASIFAFLSPYDPYRNSVFDKFLPLSTEHLFGTDALGRDLLTRILYGGRNSLLIGVLSMLVSLLIGLPIGLISGFVGGRIDQLISRFIDVFLSVPALFVMIILSAMMQDFNLPAMEGKPIIIAIIIGIFSWTTIARLARSAALSLREREYIVAAKAIGATPQQVLTHHILPNMISVVIVEATLLIGYTIFTETGLSFIGFGVSPVTPTWGNLLRDGQNQIITYPWLAFFPGAIMTLTIAAINFSGDALRDALDVYS